MNFLRSLAFLVALYPSQSNACPFLGYSTGGPNPHDTPDEPKLEEDQRVLDRRMKKRFERHVIKQKL